MNVRILNKNLLRRPFANTVRSTSVRCLQFSGLVQFFFHFISFLHQWKDTFYICYGSYQFCKPNKLCFTLCTCVLTIPKSVHIDNHVKRFESQRQCFGSCTAELKLKRLYKSVETSEYMGDKQFCLISKNAQTDQMEVQ